MTNLCTRHGCQPADINPGQLLCRSHALRVASDLNGIRNLYPDLLDEYGNALTIAQPASPGYRAKVSGSPTRSDLINLDLIDLTAPARARIEPETGLLSVATILDSWVTDWRHCRHLRETRPEPAVNTLTAWLSERLDWATSHYSQVGQFATDIDHLHRTLSRVLDQTELIHRLPAPCPTCDRKALSRRDGADRVECGSCGRIWTEDEYQRLVGVLASDHRNKAG